MGGEAECVLLPMGRGGEVPGWIPQGAVLGKGGGVVPPKPGAVGKKAKYTN